MDLVKKNIHMDHIKVAAVTQITFDEDLNLPEMKPDCSAVCFSRGNVEVSETKPFADEVRVMGNLCYHLLYYTEERGGGLVSLEGKLPFEERVHMQGVKPGDTIQLHAETEDLTVGMINSRKLNLRSVVTLRVKCDELYDEEIAIGIHAKEPIEYRRRSMDIAQIAVHKKDVFRMKEEFAVPANYPNIFQILWSNATIKDPEFKLLNGRLSIQGEVKAFILYEGEGDSHEVFFFERTIPFNGMMDCQGCKEEYLPAISWRVSQKEFGIRPDEDGEERNISLEMMLDLGIRVYEEDPVEIITDIYGVGCEVKSKCKEAVLRKALGRVAGKLKLTEKVKVRGKNGGILQVVHSEGNVFVEETKVVSEGLEVSGVLVVDILYITGEDSMPYASVQEQIPFRYVLGISQLEKTDICDLHAEVEYLQIQLLDGEEMEVKAGLGFQTTAFRPVPVELVEEVQTAPLDYEGWSMIPGMVIYIVKPGDSLWSIGKKYYIPVEEIKQLNSLESDQINVGEKLFLVKGGIGIVNDL